jgi:ERF superfamily
MQKIAAALVKAQKAFGPALKSSTNPHFKSRYADLAACVEAVIEGLNANGIFLMQPAHECQDGVIVETLFIHESGETVSAGKLRVPAAKQDAQGYGSALTYARRYSLMAACGIAPEDDDGNGASKPPKPKTGVAADHLALHPVDPDDEQYLRELAAEVVALFDSTGVAAAYERIKADQLDDTQRIYLAQQMPSNVRNAIKAHSMEVNRIKQ